MLFPACVLAGLFGSATATAQEADVFGANSSNGDIYKVEFSPPGTTIVNTDANKRKGIEDIDVLDDGTNGTHLIVCDTKRGELLYYQDSAGAGQVIASGAGAPRFPNGLSMTSTGNLLLLSSESGNASFKDAEVWAIARTAAGTLPGGYQQPFGLVDSNIQATSPVGGTPTVFDVDVLEDSHLYPSTRGIFAASDFLVLASQPAMLLRYQAADVKAYLTALAGLQAGDPPLPELSPEVLVHPPTSSVPAVNRFPAGATPAGITVSPTGELLISVTGGTVLIFGTDGNRRTDTNGNFVDFSSGSGNGKFKVSLGPQDGGFKAYVADRNGGEILRYEVQPDGTGLFVDSVTSGVQFPASVAHTTSTNTPTNGGSDVQILLGNLLESTFEEVLFPGVTNARAYLILDPREFEVVTPPNQPLHRDLTLDEIDASLPSVTIPDHVRAFPLGSPTSGFPTFILLVVDSTAGLNGIIDQYSDESVVLGYKPNCVDLDTTLRSRLFWTPDLDEEPIQEGPRFIDISTGCSSNRGATRSSFSLFLIGCRDTRSFLDVADTKMAALRQLFDEGTGRVPPIQGGIYPYGAIPCLPVTTLQSLNVFLTRAERNYALGNLTQAIRNLNNFIEAVKLVAPDFDQCQPYLESELRARASTAAFSLSEML